MAFDMFNKIPIDKIMALFTQLQTEQIEIKDLKMKCDVYDNAVVIKVLTDSDVVGRLFYELMPMLMSEIPKENIEINDHRG